MITTQATAEDFAKWQEHAKSCSRESLRYIIDDCRQAEEAMKEWNPGRSMFYSDQAMTYIDELRARQERQPG